MKYRAAYSKIYWVSFAILVFIWEMYLQSLKWIESPITARIKAIISALLISGLIVLVIWIQDKLSDRTKYEEE